MKQTTGEEIRAWKARWELVNQFEVEELRRSPPEVRYRQLLSLIQMARDFGWFEKMQGDDTEIRQRWLKLKKADRGKKKAAKVRRR